MTALEANQELDASAQLKDLLRAADRQLYANKRRAGRADLEEVAATEPIARKRGRNDIN